MIFGSGQDQSRDDEVKQRAGKFAAVLVVCLALCFVFANNYRKSDSSEEPSPPKPKLLELFLADKILAPIVGEAPQTRVDMTKKFWAYVKSHNLQDPENKSCILTDDAMRKLFDGKERLSMFGITDVINRHISLAN